MNDRRTRYFWALSAGLLVLFQSKVIWWVSDLVPLPFNDEMLYVSSALGGSWRAEWSPIYQAWYRGLMLFSNTPEGLYHLSWCLTACGVSWLMWWMLKRRGAGPTTCLVGALWIYFSEAVFGIPVRSSMLSLGASLVLFEFVHMQRMRLSTKLSILAASHIFLTYLRPENLWVAIALGIAGFWYWLHPSEKEDTSQSRSITTMIILLVGAGVALVWKFDPIDYRGREAIVDHFNLWKSWRGEQSEIHSIFFVHLQDLLHHLKNNILNLFHMWPTLLFRLVGWHRYTFIAPIAQTIGLFSLLYVAGEYGKLRVVSSVLAKDEQIFFSIVGGKSLLIALILSPWGKYLVDFYFIFVFLILIFGTKVRTRIRPLYLLIFPLVLLISPGANELQVPFGVGQGFGVGASGFLLRNVSGPEERILASPTYQSKRWALINPLHHRTQLPLNWTSASLIQLALKEQADWIVFDRSWPIRSTKNEWPSARAQEVRRLLFYNGEFRLAAEGPGFWVFKRQNSPKPTPLQLKTH